MQVRVAFLMAGSNLHARILLQTLAAEKLLPQLVIDETGTPRAEKLSRWLENDFLPVPPLNELLAGTRTRYESVAEFDGTHSQQLLRDFAPDYVISGGAGIIRENLLSLPNIGFLNVHPGLLPEYRGVDPVLWALSEGGSLGATVHLMSAGIDEGPLLIRKVLAAEPPRRTALGWRLACMCHGARLLVEFLRDPESFPPRQQDEQRARYFRAFPAERMAEVESIAGSRLAA
jgi:methionyl-tRNA formyltransferase